MRADGMGRGVARLYAKRREFLDQYTPLWVLPGQDGKSDGQDGHGDKSLKNTGGQDGQDKPDAKTIVDENTGTHAHANETPERSQSETAVPLHGPDIRVVHPVHPVRPSNGAGLSWTGRGDTDPSILSGARSWTDDRGWIAEIVRAQPGDPKMSLLFSWVISAGGWVEGTTALLPPLPVGMGRNELKRMLRQHGLALEEAPPAPHNPDCPT